MSILPIETKFFGIQRNTESKVSRIVVQAPVNVDNVEVCNTNGMLSSGSIINRIMIGSGTVNANGLPNALINNNRYRVVAVSDNDNAQPTLYTIYESLCNDSAVGPTQGGEWLHRALPEDVFLNFIRLPPVQGGPNNPFNTTFRAIIDYQAEEQPSLN
jgi:hypothetical protein